MSALGQKQTPALQKGVSALPPIATEKADIRAHVCFTPESGHVRCTSSCPLRANSGHRPYSIISSASNCIELGIVSPSVRAVLVLMTNSKFVGCSTGSSAGLVPLRTRSTRPAAC